MNTSHIKMDLSVLYKLVYLLILFYFLRVGSIYSEKASVQEGQKRAQESGLSPFLILKWKNLYRKFGKW